MNYIRHIFHSFKFILIPLLGIPFDLLTPKFSTMGNKKFSKHELDFNADPISSERYLTKYSKPIVFHFQPQQFTILEDPEDLRKWEALLIERVGMKGIVGKNLASDILANSGTCCESGSPSNDCDED